jgi:peroxiredoxin Q/BCP
MPDPGDQAPDLELSTSAGTVRLSDLWGEKKLILAFYTEDSTPLCSTQLSMLRDDYGMVRELDAEVFAISADSLDSHAGFTQRLGGLPFTLASDQALEAARAYDVIDDAGKRSRRAVFVIDRSGAILHAERWFQPGNPAQYEAIFRALGLEP